MKKILILLSFTSLLSLGCKAQKTQERTISDFKKIELSGTVNLFFTQSDTLKLVVVASSDEIERVITEIKNERLLITNKGRFSNPVNVFVSGKSLNELVVSGATNFKTQNTLKNDSLILDVAGSSNVSLQLENTKINLTQSGASDLSLKGKTAVLEAIVSGASTLKAYGLQVDNANVLTTGAATAKVNVLSKIKANASGASTIKIKGDVKELFAEATSAATIKRIESQETAHKGNDTTTFNLGDKKVIVIGNDKDDEKEIVKKASSSSNSSFKHWRGTFFGINGFLSPSGAINLAQNVNYMDLKYSRSFNTQVNIIERQFNLHKNYVKLVTGFGFDFHRYEFSKKTNLSPNTIYTAGVIDTTNSFTYKRNTLKATYLQVPLLLEFNTSNKASKTFHMALGVVGGFLVSSSTFQKLEQNSFKISKKRSDDYNLAPFVAKAHLNFGYSNWTIFAEYNLTPLFERSKGAELYPFNAGLRIIPFI